MVRLMTCLTENSQQNPGFTIFCRLQDQLLSSVSEFNEFEPRLKSAKKPVLIERRLKYWKIEYNFMWNQPYLSRGLILSRGSNSMNSASGYEHHWNYNSYHQFCPTYKIKPRLKYGWFHLKLYSIFQDLSRRSIETGLWQI